MRERRVCDRTERPSKRWHAPPVFTVSDEELALRAREDRGAFAELYTRYFERIYRHCFRRLRDREAAQDVTSEIFRKVLEKLSQFTGGSFKGWIYRIADNALHDFDRTRRPSRSLELGLPLRDPAPGPESIALGRSDVDQLAEALAVLSPIERRVVELRLDGFSSAEVAEILGPGRNAAWVRQTFHRALLRLRGHLDPQFEEDRAP